MDDAELIKSSFDLVAPRAAELAEIFYAELFYRGGAAVQDMFPASMTSQRDRLVAALVTVVTQIDDLEALTGTLRALGRDHRKFEVRPEHYDMVGQSLLSALQRVAGDAWTDDVAAAWAGAYAVIAQVMQEGAASDDGPAWWDATVTQHEARSPSVAVIRARLGRPMGYQAGQSFAVQYPGRVPRVWRFYSPANPPGSREVELHVKAEPGGMLSTSLYLHAVPGEVLRLGPPVGVLQMAEEPSPAGAVMIAGSTGLAPLKAVIGEMACLGKPSPVTLFFGAAYPEDLYDLPDLDRMAGDHEWLTVVPVVSAGAGAAPDWGGLRGSVVDAALAAGDWQGADAYVCGSSPMVRAAVTRLTGAGVPRPRIFTEDFGWAG